MPECLVGRDADRDAKHLLPASGRRLLRGDATHEGGGARSAPVGVRRDADRRLADARGASAGDHARVAARGLRGPVEASRGGRGAFGRGPHVDVERVPHHPACRRAASGYPCSRSRRATVASPPPSPLPSPRGALLPRPATPRSWVPAPPDTPTPPRRSSSPPPSLPPTSPGRRPLALRSPIAS